MPKSYAKGTQLQVGDGATPTEAFTLIPFCGDIEGPGGDTEEFDMTDHDSPANTAESIPTIVDPGQLTCTVHFDPANALHQQLAADQTDLTTRNYQLVLTDPDNTIVRFPAYVAGFRLGAPVRGALTFQLTLRIAGAIDWDAP